MASSKVYIGNLGEDGDKELIEQEFSKFGLIKDVWIARNPPGFAFVVYNDARDAEEAVRVMDNKRLCGAKIKVELSHTEDGRSSRRNDQGGGRGRGFSRNDRSRESPPRRPAMTSPQSSRSQFSRGPPSHDPSPRRPPHDSARRLPPRGPSARGPPLRGPPQRTGPPRRSPDRLENGGSFREREKYSSSGPPRDRYSYERNFNQQDGGYDRNRNDGYRGEPPASQNGYDRHGGDRHADRFNDRYPPPAPQERFRESFNDRARGRSPERGQDRFVERGFDRPMDRFQEPRHARRSPPRGPPMPGRYLISFVHS